MSNQNLKNKSIDELREMLSKGEAELKVLHNKSKYYESQINLLTRKERTHRLCTSGAMLEKFLGCPNELTDEQAEEILKIAFQPEAGASVGSLTVSTTNVTITAKINVSNKRLVSLTHNIKMGATLNNVKYSIARVGTATANLETTVKYSEFKY